MPKVLLTTGEVVDDHVLLGVWLNLQAIFREKPAAVIALTEIMLDPDYRLSDESARYLVSQGLITGLGRMNPEVRKILMAIFDGKKGLDALVTWPTTEIREPLV